MDLKKLYLDLAALCGEIPLYLFLLHADVFARLIISKYGERDALCEGEYVTPTSLSDSFALSEAFYGALLLYLFGTFEKSEDTVKKAQTAAEEACRTLRSGRLKGKRILGVKW